MRLNKVFGFNNNKKLICMTEIIAVILCLMDFIYPHATLMCLLVFVLNDEKWFTAVLLFESL